RFALSLTVLTLASPLQAQTKVPGLTLSDATEYDIKMTTKFVVPPVNGSIDQLRVYHGLPTLRPWTATGAKFGATSLNFSPKRGQRVYDAAHDAHSLLWARTGRLTPGTLYTFTSDFHVVSYTREFSPAAVKVNWKDFAKPPKDRTALRTPASAQNIHPKL